MNPSQSNIAHWTVKTEDRFKKHLENLSSHCSFLLQFIGVDDTLNHSPNLRKGKKEKYVSIYLTRGQ
ncbi:hypothetical protein V1477_021205 [Vespula maculifrons]|uniref:Uncharacterized protein n=1 Tax=Vespula maculifrons TaxID=7453 RepID=A0ABD2AGF7_VESMC